MKVRCSIQITAMINQWRRSDVPVAGVEIDHDCATHGSALCAVSSILRRGVDGRSAFDHRFTAWLSARRLMRFFSQVDNRTTGTRGNKKLPRMGLFDRQLANLTGKLARPIRTKPFRVALPATVLGKLAEDGSILTIEAKCRTWQRSDSQWS